MATNVIEKKEMIQVVKKSDTLAVPTSEEKQYLVCLTNENHSIESWEFITGRTEAYELIKDAIKNMDVDTYASFILVETCKLDQRKSIYAFMKYCESIYNDGFNIDEYVGDINIDYSISNNDISDLVDIPNIEKIDITSFMDGNINTKPLE